MRHVLVVGDTLRGFDVYGPFDFEENARTFADDSMFDNWTIHPLVETETIKTIDGVIVGISPIG